jgi:predicted RNA-binding Zn ribbon-like protein
VPLPPLLGEDLPIELANTRFTRRGVEHDGLRTPDDLAGWLARVGARLPVALSAGELEAIGERELALARELRDALRALLAAAAQGAPLDADAVETVNRTVRAAPLRRELSPGPALVVRSDAPAPLAALAAIAEQAAELLAGPDAETLRACSAPGCVLFYRKTHPRRTCCSPRCADRARAARHYARRTGRAVTEP